MNTMWCTKCGQDVPGVASESGLCCVRCGQTLGDGSSSRSREDQAVEQTVAEQAASSDPPYLYDSWELDEQLRHVGRVLGSEKGAHGQPDTVGRQEVARLDPPHSGSAGWHGPPERRQSPRTADGESRSTDGVLPFMSWAALSLGLMAFVCGGVLLGWSILGGRPDLWSIGMPIMLAGQIGLLAGLVLQLDRLWQDNRSTAAKLDQVDDELHDLKTTTTMLGTDHGSSGRAFYSHLADGAGPQLLLTDLKSQLDLLAVKLGQQRS